MKTFPEPVGQVCAPNETRPYNHFVRLREPRDDEIGAKLYALREEQVARLEAREKALVEALTRFAVEPDYDWPGDSPILCGMTCSLCRAHTPGSAPIEHEDSCLLSSRRPA